MNEQELLSAHATKAIEYALAVASAAAGKDPDAHAAPPAPHKEVNPS